MLFVVQQDRYQESLNGGKAPVDTLQVSCCMHGSSRPRSYSSVEGLNSAVEAILRIICNAQSRAPQTSLHSAAQPAAAVADTSNPSPCWKLELTEPTGRAVNMHYAC